MIQSVMPKIIKQMQASLDMMQIAKRDPLFQEVIRNRLSHQLTSDGNMLKELEAREPFVYGLIRSGQEAKTIVFPSEQALVFVDSLSKINFDLDYILPFPSTFIQFSEPVSISLLPDSASGKEVVSWLTKGMSGLLLTQSVTKDEDVLNCIYLLHHNLHRFRFVSWLSGDPGEDSWYADGRYSNEDGLQEIDIRNLAKACIGYINCENVYLERTGGADEATNQRRVRKGKSRLEPYYVCRIRGVQYDSAGNPTGEGTKHGIRYDVRGHFRRMDGGKTTWVRPHQRGLANELYVPKTYLVAKA